MGEFVRFRLRLPHWPANPDSLVEIDGVDVTKSVTAVTVSASIDDITHIIVEFLSDQVDVDGEGELRN